jgi:hypothetical protein
MEEAFGAFEEAPVTKANTSKSAPAPSADDFLLNVAIPSNQKPSSKPAENDLFGNFNSAPVKANPTPSRANQNADDVLFGGFSSSTPSQRNAPSDDLFGGFSSAPAQKSAPAADDLFGGFSSSQPNQEFEVVRHLKGQPVSVKPKAPPASTAKPASNPSDPWGNLVNLGDLTGSMSSVSISQAPKSNSAPAPVYPNAGGYYNPGAMYPPQSGYGAAPPHGYGMMYPPPSSAAAPMYSGMPYGAPPASNNPAAADPFASMYSSARKY